MGSTKWKEGRKDLKPDSNALNLVLKACSTAPAMWKDWINDDKNEDSPIVIANRVFATLRGGNEFDATLTHGSYSYMFRTYRVHMNFEDERYFDVMQELWKHSCRDGLVSQFSLESFREAVLSRDFWSAIGGQREYARRGKTRAEDIKVGDLPELGG